MKDEKKIETIDIEINEEENSEMNVRIVKEGFFTRVGRCLDRNKKKIAIGAAAAAGAIGMIIFVGRNHSAIRDEENPLNDDVINVDDFEVIDD